MHLLNTLLVGFKDIWAHKFRSLLSMLGIILGVASLVGMSAIIAGMENGLRETMIATGGANKFWLRDQEVPAYQEHLADQATGRRLSDVIALQNNAPLLQVISPEMELDDAMVSRGKETAWPSEVLGVWPAVLEMNLYTVEHGRFFTPLDEERANPVCVIGSGIRDELFGSPDETGQPVIPIGETILINRQPFTIVGLFKHYESEQERIQREIARQRAPDTPGASPLRRRSWGRHSPFWRKNNVVYIPLNTMWVRFRSSSGTDGIPDPRLSDIDLKVPDLSLLERAIQQARNVMMLTHHGIEDFSFSTQESTLENINRQIHNARLSGSIIAAISLLVGGIGIMNIMLASINERIRELGICKAVGATGTAIFVQILVEGVVVALVGGFLGVGASFGLVEVLALISPTQNAPVVTPLAMVVATGFSAAVGVIASLWPALKAARLNPIQALRYE